MNNYIQQFIKWGLSVFPLIEQGKTPATKHGFKDAQCSIDQLSIWEKNPKKNIGIATGVVSKISVIDIDIKSGGYESLEILKNEYGLDTNTVTVKTPSGGMHLWFYDDKGAVTRAGVMAGIDIRGDKGYVVAPPSIHPNGGMYTFSDPNMINKSNSEVLSLLKPFPHDIFEKIVGKKKVSFSTEEGKIQSGFRFEYLRTMLGKMRRSGIDRENARNLLHEENSKKCLPPKTAKEVDGIVDGIYNLSSDNPIISAAHTDLGNAERLVSFAEGNLKFISRMDKWHIYDGTRFKVDEGSNVIKIVKAMLRFAQDLNATAPDSTLKVLLAKHLKKSESRSKIQALLSLAESELGESPDTLDSDPYLFNVLNGTVDLKTGKLHPHQLKNNISKISNINFCEKQKCPRFLKFLDEVFAGDKELIQYFQKVVGYSLTGDTKEQVLFLLNGSGSNGKSTMINVFKKLLGEYCRSSDISTFTLRQSEQIRNDLARLFDARLVSSVEVQEGKYIDESVIKMVTGGDPVTCRFLFHEHFEYIPKWKLFLAVNHLPHITGTDKGIWRRIHIVPFEVSFEGEKKDPNLQSLLDSEISGVLNWAIKGCLLWQKEGLQKPSAISNAVAVYKTDEDTLGDFLSEFTLKDPSHTILASSLFSVYAKWQKLLGQRPMSIKQFGQKLAIKGFAKKRGAGGRIEYIGLKIIAELPADLMPVTDPKCNF